MAVKLEKRLAKVEQVLAERAQQKVLANCNCRDSKTIFRPGKEGLEAGIEAELKLTCPVHAERRLARPLIATIVSTKPGIPNPPRNPLFDEYERRYARQLERMREDDAEDF